MHYLRFSLIPVFTLVFSLQVLGDEFASPDGHEFGSQSKATLRDAFQAGVDKDFPKFLAVAAPRYIQHSPDLPDGWKPVWDLLINRPAGFISKQVKWLGKGGFLDNGRYLIMLREVQRGDGSPASKVVDIMLFDAEGKYAEHWDIRQKLSEKTASGRSETGVAAEFANNPVNYDEEIEEANKKTVADFLDLAFNQQKLDEALKRYVSDDYLQHSPRITDGADSLKAVFDSGKMPALNFDIQLIAAQNDLVVVFAKVKAGSQEMAVVDINRVRDGKLVEHWDVIQQVPLAEEMPHTNGMFYLPENGGPNRTNVGAIELISYKPKKQIALADALALDLRVKQHYVVKQRGFIDRHTGVTEDGTVYVQVLWDSLESVKASQAKGMKDELMGQYMQIMDQPSIEFHNITVKQ